VDLQFWDEHVGEKDGTKSQRPLECDVAGRRCLCPTAGGTWSSTDELNIAVTQLWRRKICVLRLLETDAIMLADVVIEEYQTGTTSLRNLPRR
jgi:hypothetical protein